RARLAGPEDEMPNMLFRRLLLTAASLLAIAARVDAAQPPCPGGRYLLQQADGPLITGGQTTLTFDAVAVGGGRVSIDSGCQADRARKVKIKGTRKATKITAIWDTCGTQQKVRLTASITVASGCQTMSGVRKAKRSPKK